MGIVHIDQAFRAFVISQREPSSSNSAFNPLTATDLTLMCTQTVHNSNDTGGTSYLWDNITIETLNLTINVRFFRRK